MNLAANNYVVGRGRMFFGQFAAGTNTVKEGELYFGNTPELTLTGDTQTLDHYSSESGMRELDESVLLELTQGGKFTTDNISQENVALFFLGDHEKTTQSQQTGVKELIPTLKRGRTFQLGTSTDNPTGVRNIKNVVVGVADSSVSVSTGAGDISSIPGVSVLTANSGNFELDLELGRIYIEPDAGDIADGQQMIVSFDVEAQVREQVIGKGNIIYGCLRFIADNPVGANKDLFFPKVTLQPDGDYSLKGDEWQKIGFAFKALRLNAATQRVYTDVRSAGLSSTLRTVSYSVSSSTGTAGGAAVNVTFTVRDSSNNVVANEVVNFTTVGGATLTAASGTTNASGQVVASVSRATAGSATVTASLTTGESITSSAITFS